MVEAIYHSKWSNAIALYAEFNWGVRVEKLSPPFFLAYKNDKKIVFESYIVNTYLDKIDIAVNLNADFLVLVFADKPGNNLILLSMSDVSEIVSRPFDIQEIVQYIKAKDQLEISHG